MTALASLKATLRTAADRLIDKALWIGLGFLALLATGWFIWHSVAFNPIAISTKSAVRDVIIGSVQVESVLNTASQPVTANVTIEKTTQLFHKFPIGETNLVYAAVGSVQAGIDINQIEVVELDSAARSVTLRLPAAQISDIHLDVERSTTLANYRQWLSPKAGADFYEAAQRQAQAKMRSQAYADHILETAQHNAASQIEGILRKVGFTTVSFAGDGVENS